MTYVSALQAYKKAMKIESDFSCHVPMSKDDERLEEAQIAVLSEFGPCEPAGKVFVWSTGESLPFSSANPGVMHVSPASSRVGSLYD